MRVRGTLSCVAAVGVVLTAAGCGGDDSGGDAPVAASVPTVPVAGTTVTTTATVTVPTTTTMPTTVTRPVPSPAPAGRNGASTTTGRSTADAAPATTAAAPTTTTQPEDDSDPVGGTTFSLGPGRGTGYTVRVPSGWFDGSRRLEGSGVPFDLTYVRGRGSDVTSNILIVRRGGAAKPGQHIADFARRVRSDIDDTSANAEVSTGPDLRIDGEHAISFVVRRKLSDRRLVQRRVAVLHRGALFTVGLTSLQQDASHDEDVFRAFLRSWRWE